jgi:hypothetical protein
VGMVQVVTLITVTVRAVSLSSGAVAGGRLSPLGDRDSLPLGGTMFPYKLEIEDMPVYDRYDMVWHLYEPNGQLVWRWKGIHNTPHWFDFILNKNATYLFLLTLGIHGSIGTYGDFVNPGPIRQQIEQAAHRIMRKRTQGLTAAERTE